MLVDLLLLIPIFVCLFLIILIVAKKVPLVARIKLEEIPKERETEIKQQLLEAKLQRELKSFRVKLLPIFSPIGSLFRRGTIFLKKNFIIGSKALFRRLEQIQRPIKPRKSFQKLLAEGTRFLGKDNLIKAEKKFAEAITLSPKNLGAWRRLKEVYSRKRDYQRSEDLLRHILKLSWPRKKQIQVNGEKEQLVKDLLSLAEVYKVQEKNEEAMDCLKKALNFQPNSPKILDYLLDLAIITKDKKLARVTLKKLKEVNPENQKIAHLAQLVEQLYGKE